MPHVSYLQFARERSVGLAATSVSVVMMQVYRKRPSMV